MAFFIPIFEPNNKNMAISTNDIKIRYVIDTSELTKAQQGFDKLSQEEKQAINELKKLNTELNKTSSNASETGGGLMSAFKKGKDGIGGFIKALGPVGTAIAGAFTVTAIVGFAKSIFEVTAQFQKLEAVLKNTLGSSSAAYAAMSDIQEFAKTTPFSVDELTSSFVKLANQGFRPSMDQMRKLGDLASSTGKSFDQLAEAIIDAQVGEFERLKEFGVRASKSGDMITFSFKGVETQVRNNNEAIQQYLLSLGDYEGVAGSAAAVSGTLGGKVNNLGDAWDKFLVSIGESLGPILATALDVTAEFMDKISYLFSKGAGEAKKYKEQEAEIYKENKSAGKYSNMLEEELAARKAEYTQGLADAKKYLEEAQKLTKNMYQWQKDIYGYMPIRSADVQEAIRTVKVASEEIAHYQANLAGIADEEKARRDEIIKKNKEFDEWLKEQKKADEEWAKKYNQKLKEEEEARKKAEEDAKRAAAEAKARRKERYEDELKAAKLRSDIEKLQAELAGKGQEEQLMLEAAYQEDVLKIKQKYLKKGIDLTKNDIEQQKIVFKKAQNEANKEASKNYQDKLDAQKKAEQEQLDERNKYQEELLKKEQEFADLMAKLDESILKAEVDAREKAEKDKQSKIEATFQLANTLLSGFSSAYQTSISNEIAAMNKRYDNEVAMAQGNEQKIQEINNRRAEQERELKQKAFKAEQTAAVARVIFETASLVAKWASNPISAGLAALTLANQAAQIGFIMAQPVPEFAEGTKGKPFKGGRAMVGEKGIEKVVTASGKVYFTPPTATLVDLPSGSQVIPNHALSKQELFYASRYSGGSQASSPITGKLDELGSILRSLPITQLNMDERGFEKYIRTEKRATKILNNRFRS